MRLCLIVTLVVSTGCTSMAVGMVGSALSGGGSVYASDDDPELVEAAIPFGLKTMEGLLAREPENRDLLLAAASGFTQYAYAFVLQKAHQVEPDDFRRSRELIARCQRLFARAREYGLRGLEVEHEGFRAALAKDPKAAVAMLSADDVPMLYWTAAPWAALISVSKDDLERVAQLGDVEVLMTRALALDETFDHGALHELFLAYEAGRSESMGGSIERARHHFDRALELSNDQKVGPLVTWAEQVAVQNQNREEFEAYLDRALAFDTDSAPHFRLNNLIAQARARRLKARMDDLFLEEQ